MGPVDGLVVSPTSQSTDELNFQNANVFRENTGQCRPGHWVFIGPGAAIH